MAPGDGLARLRMARDHRDAARAVAGVAVQAALECLRDAFVLDRVAAEGPVPLKPRQAQLARALGIDVPRSLVTNDPDRARAFARSCGGGAIVKMLETSTVTVAGSDGEDDDVIYTRAFDPDEDLAGLEIAPMMFQERVPKALEARVTVVGRRVFAAAVDPRGSSLAADDWRRDRALVRAFRPYELPRAVEGRLLRLLDALGLEFAAIDLIVTPDGRHVFIEVNAIAYFDFVEKSAGLPISDAVADLLVGRARPRLARA
jgi:glutathione synthase/RimK-type ligase-like ATP-grasp enzyme